MGRGLDAISAMKSDARRRWRLLTSVGAFGRCCDARLAVVVETLRACLDLDLFDLELKAVVGGIVAALGADLLLDACVCGFGNVTLVESRFW